MYLIYDKKIKRNIGMTEEETDVSQMSVDYELREWTQEGEDDFNLYKIENSTPSEEVIVEEKVIDPIQEKELERQAQSQQSILISFAIQIYTAYKDFWFNPIITPQEQCDLREDGGLGLFDKHAKGVQFVLENLPNVTDFIPDFMDITHIQDDKEYNIVDGKIIISDKVLPIE